jgi:hypothetical protein
MSNISLPNPTWAGTAITAAVEFYNPVVGEPQSEWPLVDPTTVTLTFIAGLGAEPVEWVYGGFGSIVRQGVGVYYAELTTSGTSGTWQVKWVGTGACAAVTVQGFPVVATPF